MLIKFITSKEFYNDYEEPIFWKAELMFIQHNASHAAPENVFRYY